MKLATRLWNLAAGLGLALLSIALLLCAGEALARIYFSVRYGESLIRTGRPLIKGIELDPVLGWKPAANYHAEYDVTLPDGKLSHVHYSQGRDGFRTFGQLNTTRKKIFVIGDSFTYANAVSNGETYYDLLGRLLDAEIFAYGMSAYGTLQEAIVLDQYLDQIRPDLIVCQFCVNDFVNNSLALDARAVVQNVFLVRPYFDGRKVVNALPFDERFGPWMPYATERSQLLRIVSDRLRVLHTRYYLHRDSYDEVIAGRMQDLFKKSVDITSQILTRMQKRAGSIPILGFDCLSTEPYHSSWRKLAQEHRIPFVDAVTARIDAEERNGRLMHLDKDGHWNQAGHRLAAETLADYIRTTSGWKTVLTRK
ncbi:MAG: SGNH/GDSL hydrolase family protein [Acidobacteriia bacterium]|nr:SGNH/GDSL hydrolase family protein [Terriglobia bacterium]